jgi:hypothetical protein
MPGHVKQGGFEGYRRIALRSMAFKLEDRVSRSGQPEICTVEDIRDPDDHFFV